MDITGEGRRIVSCTNRIKDFYMYKYYLIN